MRMELNDMTPEAKTRVLWLHHEVFHDSACNTCPGNCCVDCHRTGGYLHYGRSPENVKALQDKYGWTDKDGFRNGPQGCKLPAHERSSTCLSFACGGVNVDPMYPKRWGPPMGVNKPFDHKPGSKLSELRDAFYDKNNMNTQMREAFERLKGGW